MCRVKVFEGHSERKKIRPWTQGRSTSRAKYSGQFILIESHEVNHVAKRLTDIYCWGLFLKIYKLPAKNKKLYAFTWTRYYFKNQRITFLILKRLYVQGVLIKITHHRWIQILVWVHVMVKITPRCGSTKSIFSSQKVYMKEFRFFFYK